MSEEQVVIEELNEDSDRKLVYIAKITDLQPIEGADRIECATINEGWHCVVKKGEFQVRDLCVYIEIDSLLPDIPAFEFLKDKNRPDKPIRVKTVRLRGQISQGLAMPISSIFGETWLDEETGTAVWYDDNEGADHYLYEGNDLTSLIGITKYIPKSSAVLSGIARGDFPHNLVPKTDEDRIQILYSEIEGFVRNTYPEDKWVVTEKLDGSSVTFIINEDEFSVCSRNLNLAETEDNAFWELARKLDIEEKMRNYGGLNNFAIQGEMVGPGIQKNKLNLSEISLRVFNVYDISQGVYLDHHAMVAVVNELGLETVPVIHENFPLLHDDGVMVSVDGLVSYVTRKSVINPKAWAEGYVFRPLKEHFAYKIGRVSFKVINPEFLLSNGE